MADRRNESLDIEEGSVYDRKRRRVKRANLVLLILAVVVAVVAVSFSAYFMATSGLRQSAGSSDRNMDDGTTARDEVDAGWAGEYSDGLYFDLNSKGTEYEVISSDRGYSKIVIPAEYEGLPVTSIADGAFSGCTSLKSVTIGKNVTKIGDSAFYNCTALTEIHYNAVCADDLTGFYNRTFYNAGQSGKGIAVTIGAEVERIPAYLFYPFYDYSNFPKTLSVEFEKGSVCESIGRLAFAYNTSLTSADIPGSVVEIESEAFYGCTSLIDLTIAEGVESIGTHAFAGCTSLSDVTIPDSVESIRNYAFNGCSSLERLTIGAGVTDFGYDVFYECTSLRDVTIKEGVTCIGDMAFSRCTSLSEITIPGSVESIGGSAFYDCTALSSIEIPDGVESIGNSAFNGCTALTSLTIGEDVESIGRSAFRNCTSLTSVYYNAANAENMSSGSDAFYNAGATSGEVMLTIGKSVESVPEYMFCQSNITSVVFEEGSICESIGDYAFANCASLTNVVISDSVKYIGSAAFSGCGALEILTLPFVGESFDAESASPSTLMGYIFGTTSYAGSTSVTQCYNASDSATYYIPSGLSDITVTGGEIFYGSFYGCASLKSISIGMGVTSIGDRAFYGCTGLTEIYYDAAHIGDLSYGCDIFDMAGQNGKGMTVTIGSDVVEISAYLFCSDQGYYGAPNVTSLIFEGESTCESIGQLAFAYCASLKHVVIPDSVKYIGDGAFSHCAALKDLEIGEGVIAIGEYAFYFCDSLSAVTVPDSVTTIGVCAFSGCGGLESITLPFVGGSALAESASESTLFGYIFGQSSFDGGTMVTQYYSSSESVTYCIPGNLEEVAVTGGQILYGAFCNCSSLKSVVIGDGVTSIESFAFSGCGGLVSITLPFVGLDATASSASSSTLFGYIFGTTSYTGGKRVRQYYGSYSSTYYYIPDTLEDVTVTGGQLLYGAFYNCSSLKTITLGDGVTGIAGYAFCNCSSLTHMVVPDSVTSIGSAAFSGCSGLESITLPFVGGRVSATSASIVTLFGYIFGTDSYDGGTSTTQYYENYYYGTVDYYIPSNLTEVVITGGQIMYGTFSGCKTLKSVAIPESATSVGSYAFYNCTSLVEMTVPDGVASIGDHAFYNCKALKSVNIPESVLTVGYYSFAYCSSLNEITIPYGVTTIGAYAFYYCTSLTAVSVPDSVTTIGGSAFSCCRGLESITLPFVGGSASATSASIATLFGYIFGTTSYSGGTAITQCYSYYSSATFYIPSKLTEVIVTGGQILYGAFYGYDFLTSIAISEGVTSIGSYAFYNCASLVNISISDSVTSIGSYAFSHCSSLTSIDIPNEVKTIKDSTFYRCTSLATIVIPSGVTTIENYAFSNCTSLSFVYYAGTADDWDKITVNGTGNSYLTNAAICYYSETSVEDGSHWHYVDGVPAIWGDEGE